MSIGKICNREVVVAGRGITARAAAQLMREHHVGSLVVVDEGDERQSPIGISWWRWWHSAWMPRQFASKT